ncbi:MAG TPA: hypothetical protein VN875_21350, partial [Candidatus Binatus sp.]|nr:hypothetical protein [Candidatus Binatus sp.]
RQKQQCRRKQTREPARQHWPSMNRMQLIKMSKNSTTQYATRDERASDECEQESRAYLALHALTDG